MLSFFFFLLVNRNNYAIYSSSHPSLNDFLVLREHIWPEENALGAYFRQVKVVILSISTV